MNLQEMLQSLDGLSTEELQALAQAVSSRLPESAEPKRKTSRKTAAATNLGTAELTPLDAPIPELPEYRVYTDGACSNNQAGGMQPGAWAAVFADGRCFADGGQGTNQIFELKGAIEALRRTPKGSRVTVCSDSAYVVNAFLQNWFAGWDRRGWTNVKGEPVANQPLWRELRALAGERKVTWEKVKGHADDELNNLADRLAVAAIPKGGGGR